MHSPGARWAVALVLLAACGVSTYRVAPVRGELQMRLVAAEGASGEALPRWSSGEALTLEPSAFVDASNVREVRLENRPDDTRHIVLYLDEEGTQRLAEVTRAHEGRRLAVVVAGRVVVAPTIRSPITDGVAHITVDPEQVEEVFDALTREPGR